MQISEQKTIRRCQQGQLNEFGQLYDRYAEPIYRFIYYRTHHQPTAEDLTSSTFLKALEHFNNFDAGRGTFSAWLYRIARNTITDYYRTRKETVDIEDVWDLGTSTDLPRDLDLRHQLKQVSQYLALFPARDRDIILMRVWDELSYREISEIINCTEASCKMAFSRAIKKLRAQSTSLYLLLMLFKYAPLA